MAASQAEWGEPWCSVESRPSIATDLTEMMVRESRALTKLDEVSRSLRLSEWDAEALRQAGSAGQLEELNRRASLVLTAAGNKGTCRATLDAISQSKVLHHPYILRTLANHGFALKNRLAGPKGRRR